MQRDTLRKKLREIWLASSLLMQKEGDKLTTQQHDSAKTIHDGIERLKQALQEVDRYSSHRHLPADGNTDWYHLLLNPLTLVRGYSKLLLDGAFGQLSGLQIQLVSTIHNQAEPMTALIEDLYLDVDRPYRQSVIE